MTLCITIDCNSIICEEAWEKGPIVSKYCFEKNTLKVRKYLGGDQK